MYTQPHAARRSARPPRRTGHWFNSLPVNLRSDSIGWKRCPSQRVPPRAPPLPFPDTSGVLKRPFEVTSKIYF